MSLWIVACIAEVDDDISIVIVNAPSWQEALNKSPAVWWHTPPYLSLDEATALAWNTYRCHIAIKPL